MKRLSYMVFSTGPCGSVRSLTVTTCPNRWTDQRSLSSPKLFSFFAFTSAQAESPLGLARSGNSAGY